MSGAEVTEPQAGGEPGWGRLPVVPRWLGVTALVVVLLAVCGWVIGEQLSSSSPKHKATPGHGSPSTGKLATFKAPDGLFQISYPTSWKASVAHGPQTEMVAVGPNGDSFLITKASLSQAVGTGNIGAGEKLAEKVIKRGDQAKILGKPELETFDGLPTLSYLYTFLDPTTGNLVAHVEYFMFDGTTMITLVFEAVPSTRLTSEAPTFDKIASTFKFSGKAPS